MADELDQIKKILGGGKSDIVNENNSANTGLNMDSTVNQIPKGSLTYALNASIENFDPSSVNYQNEPGNEHCFQFPEGYQLIGEHAILEKNKHIFFLATEDGGDSEIGYMENNDCVYHTLVNAPCLNFNIHYPVHKVVHKISNCSTEIYWTDGYNPRRYLDIDNIPYTLESGSPLCDPVYTNELDCNQIKVQPNFSIPNLEISAVNNGGDLIAGTYQFAIQYCDAQGNAYSSYYSVTNPTPIFDPQVTTLNFNYRVGKSIDVSISNLDLTGQFQYFNLAVIKTVNDIPSVELAGTYFINGATETITYTGQNVTQISLVIADIFEKFPYYEIAQDLTTAQDVLIWDNLTSIDRINYQSIANQITFQWETYRIPNTEDYSDELNATNLRGYLRDEVYAFEIVFLLKNGKQTDGFHIPGRAANADDLTPVYPTNADFIGTPNEDGYSEYWKIYNTGTVEGFSPGYLPDTDYKGPYQYGEFAYWESEELYPCNELVWGDLSNQPIRHHKFPDVLVSPIIESAIFSSPSELVMRKDAIYPIGVKINISQLNILINGSALTQDQKDSIEGFKIVRGDRATNKSIVAKGILRNVGAYNREGTDYYYPNYPYNDIKEDPFLLTKSNAYTSQSTDDVDITCRSFTVTVATLGPDDAPFSVEYIDCYTNTIATKTSTTIGEELTFCTISFPAPTITSGTGCIVCNTYKTYKIIVHTIEQVAIFELYPPDKTLCGPPPYDNACDYCLEFPTSDCCVTPIRVYRAIYAASPIISSITYPKLLGGTAGYHIDIVEEFGQEVCTPLPLNSFQKDPDLKYRQIFNSPETSFGQPFLGNVLKIEDVMFGAGRAHFVQVKRNAQNRLITKEAQNDALKSATEIANITLPSSASALFAAYQAYLTIYINGITRRNYSWSFNSIASYDYAEDVENNTYDPTNNILGIKQRELDIAQYLIPGVQSAGDNNNINNWNRESSVYLKTFDTVKDLEREYVTYRICNTGVFPQTFSYTDVDTLVTTDIIILITECKDVDSTTYPVFVGGDVNYTIVNLGTFTKDVLTNIPPLLFPSQTPSISPAGVPIVTDNSRFVLSDDIGDCNNPGNQVAINVLSYYASIKNINNNQWGQIYSYLTIDTGFQRDIKPLTQPVYDTIFGGDTFITKFAFKTKLPFFIDNRVNAPDDADIYYDEIGNVAYPTYWWSSRSVLSSPTVSTSTEVVLTNFISIKANNLDCPNSQGGPNDTTVPGRTYYDGKMYQFAYGIPYFYCESSYNVDLRQAFNNKEGDFWPHVSTDIPDDWVQESNVTIAQDNTYYYNVTYSKQNKENYFSHLPTDWKDDTCYTYYPFRTIYSEAANENPDNKVNSWLNYSAGAQFDFPQNYGKLVSLDGIQNKAVLARFENKSLLYNTMLTINTSNPQAAYIGNNTLFRSSPPVDFAETDLGYVGSQNKMLLKIPNGQVTVDAKRGQVFLVVGNQVKDISGFGSGMNKFFTNNLSFEILNYFPDKEVEIDGKTVIIPGVDVDNNFTGVGLHGVYDSKYDRVILTKLDYIPKYDNIIYDHTDRNFYQVTAPAGIDIRTQVYLTDLDYFCNKSWTVSYNMNTGTWISFHSYLPNWYIGENNFFYSGLNDCCGAFDAIAGNIVPEPSTTTTTSSSTTTTTSSSTTSTTTTLFTGCDLEGNAVIYDCALEGTAVDITPTTTTTTTAVPEIAAIVFLAAILECDDDNTNPYTGIIYLPVTSNWFVLSGGVLKLDNVCPSPPIYPDEDFISTAAFSSYTVSAQSVNTSTPIYADGTYIINSASLVDPVGPNIILTITGTSVVYSICPCPTITTTT